MGFISSGINSAVGIQDAVQTANVAGLNAAQRRTEADVIKKAGTVQQEQLDRNKRRVLGASEAAFATTGLTGGSEAAILADTVAELALDAEIAEFNTSVAASFKETEAGLQDFYKRAGIRRAKFIGGTAILGAIGATFGGSSSTPNPRTSEGSLNATAPAVSRSSGTRVVAGSQGGTNINRGSTFLKSDGSSIFDREGDIF